MVCRFLQHAGDDTALVRHPHAAFGTKFLQRFRKVYHVFWPFEYSG